MQLEEKERTIIQQVLDTLPAGHTVIKDAHKALIDKGHKISKRSLYEVVKGRSKKPVFIEAILDAAQAERTRRAELDARARQLVAEA